MAARLNTRQIDSVREHIRTTQIIKRLSSHIDGDIELQASQVTAALGLLKKVLPDLAVTQLTGDKENPIYVANSLIDKAQERLASNTERVVAVWDGKPSEPLAIYGASVDTDISGEVSEPD